MAKPETSEQQQSFFYVVWPEERSPVAGATASSTPNLIAMNAAGSSGASVDTFLTPSSASPPGYSAQGTRSSPSASSLGPLIGATGYSPSSSAAPGAGTAATLSGTEDSDSSAADSPAPTNISQTASTAAIVAAAAQTITVTDSGEFSGGSINTSTTVTPHNVLISPRSHAFGLPANGAGTITTVYNPVSSPGLLYVSDAPPMLSSRSTVPVTHSAHHTIGHHHPSAALHPAAPGHRGNGSSVAVPLLQESLRKQRHLHPSSSTEVPPLRNIGTWAEQAMGNLQKIIKAVSQEESPEEGGPARKRVCVRDITAHSDCLECEVKDAEINVLRKRVLALQDQVSAMQRLPNGNVKSPLSPSSVSPTPQQMETTIQLQIDPMHHVTKELLQQQRRRSRPGLEHPQVPDPLSSGTPPELQAQQVQAAQPQPQHQPQPGEAVELVAGSGVYILAYRLQEARREAKTGTQLARKLMDCFWDKETLAKSTLTPRSKFQYQQLDPKIIKAIEVYCLSYDAGAQSKDIHATMTDKCCQARSRTRGFQ